MQNTRTPPLQPDHSAITVRPVFAEEWPQAIGVLNTVYVGGGYTSAEKAKTLFHRDTLEPAGVVLVAVDQRSVLGVVLLLHPGSDLAQVANDGEAEFRLLAVSPHARQRGAGELLVRRCIQLSASPPHAAKTLVMWTRPQMVAALRMYDRLGFRRAPDRDAQLDPLPAGSPALERWVYCRALDPLNL
ncbi:MAG: GNAT family N-acetyltransferase [Phycisphaerales bacterium JB065]